MNQQPVLELSPDDVEILDLDPEEVEILPTSSKLLRPRAPGDVMSRIAERRARPPAAAKGDPRARAESGLERVFPAAAHPGAALSGFVQAINPLPLLRAGSWEEGGLAAGFVDW
jgi:hypothetical protein